MMHPVSILIRAVPARYTPFTKTERVTKVAPKKVTQVGAVVMLSQDALDLLKAVDEAGALTDMPVTAVSATTMASTGGRVEAIQPVRSGGSSVPFGGLGQTAKLSTTDGLKTSATMTAQNGDEGVHITRFVELQRQAANSYAEASREAKSLGTNFDRKI